jgi:regulatory protein
MPARTRRFADPPSEATEGHLREVTDIQPDPRAPGYYIVEVDGARFASLPEEAVAHLGLEPATRLPPEAFERLRHVADVEAAYQVAIRLLATRPRAVNEMLLQLRNRGHNPSVAAEAVGRLEANGLLNDVEFARHFARVRSDRGHGPARLISDLLARGVDKRTAERAVYEIIEAEEVDPMTQARALLEKRALQLGRIPPEKKRRRLLAYLGRRGYRGYEIDEMVREVLGREQGAGSGEQDDRES